MSATTSTALRDRYVDLLMGCLTRELFLDEEAHDVDLSEWPGDVDELRGTLRTHGWRLTRRGGSVYESVNLLDDDDGGAPALQAI